MSKLSDHQLLAWLDELLPVAEMTAVEEELRQSDALRQRVAALLHRRDSGHHSVGEIWRRRRLSCPSRTDWGSWLLGTLDEDHAAYLEFHLRTIGCRFCAANVADLKLATANAPASETRRQRYFQSSAGLLPKNNE